MFLWTIMNAYHVVSDYQHDIRTRFLHIFRGDTHKNAEKIGEQAAVHFRISKKMCRLLHFVDNCYILPIYYS